MAGVVALKRVGQGAFCAEGTVLVHLGILEFTDNQFVERVPFFPEILMATFGAKCAVKS